MERMGKILVLIFTIQVAYATSRGGSGGGGTLGQVKCNCPPVGGGAGGGIGGGIGSPPVGGGSGGGIGGPPVGGGTEPVYSSPPPAGGSIPATPSLTPPYGATPSTPRHSPPSPSRGGSSSPATPSVPSYGVSPPSPSSSSPPSVPSYGTPPVRPPPSSTAPVPPLVGTSPSPTDPGVPFTPPGSTPSLPGFPPLGIIPGLPGSGTGTCKFWGSHPWLFPNVPSILSSIGDLFGSGPLIPSSVGKGMTVEEALRNRRRDGYGSLLREGTASLLNSFVNPAFEYAPQQVRSHFNSALRSNRAAAVQGAKFKAANEGRLH